MGKIVLRENIAAKMISKMNHWGAIDFKNELNKM